MTVEKPKPKQLLRPITTETNSTMNQSQFLAITCNSLKARENSRVQGGIGFGVASYWLTLLQMSALGKITFVTESSCTECEQNLSWV